MRWSTRRGGGPVPARNEQGCPQPPGEWLRALDIAYGLAAPHGPGEPAHAAAGSAGLTDVLALTVLLSGVQPPGTVTTAAELRIYGRLLASPGAWASWCRDRLVLLEELVPAADLQLAAAAWARLGRRPPVGLGAAVAAARAALARCPLAHGRVAATGSDRRRGG